MFNSLQELYIKKNRRTLLRFSETNEKEDYHGWTRLILNSGVPQAALRKATSSLMKPKTSPGVPVLASKILLFLSFQRFQTVYMMIAATFLLCRPVTAARVLCHQSAKERKRPHRVKDLSCKVARQAEECSSF